ncbi:uncharacterized protein LOC130010649, partial [Patella vulgata]|uniref:uncharacterized protein LOC130010649 n=1 Tax=Patella vulgata TaxID=6465 RepID=UPI0024A7D1BA
LFWDLLPDGYEYHICSPPQHNSGGFIADIRVAITTETEAKKWKENYVEKTKLKSLKYRNVSDETVEDFKNLFSRGHSPESALNRFKVNCKV